MIAEEGVRVTNKPWHVAQSHLGGSAATQEQSWDELRLCSGSARWRTMTVADVHGNGPIPMRDAPMSIAENQGATHEPCAVAGGEGG